MAALRLCFLLVLPSCLVLGSAPAIGVATALGPFMLDNARVQANANVFAGSNIQTREASTQVFLKDGPIVILGVNSEGVLFGDHVRLRQGVTRVDDLGRFTVEAAGYRLQSTRPVTNVVVRLDGSNVQVATLVGAVEVHRVDGSLAGKVPAGDAFETEPKADTANVAAQSPATAGQSGATTEDEERRRKRRKAALWILLAGAAAGIGAGIAASGGVSGTPTSP